jgi:hypothetical protein
MVEISINNLILWEPSGVCTTMEHYGQKRRKKGRRIR